MELLITQDVMRNERRQKVKDELEKIVLDEKSFTACFNTYPLSEYYGEKQGMLTKTFKNCRDRNKKTWNIFFTSNLN